MSKPAVEGSSPTPAPAAAPAAAVPAPVVPAAPAAPAVPSTPAAPAAAPEAPKITPADVAAALSPDERRMVASGAKKLHEVLAARPKPTQPAAPSTPAPAAPAAPATPDAAAAPAATPAPEAPAAPADPNAAPPTEPASDDLPDRFRFKDEADRAVALIAKTRKVSLVEAARIFAADNPGAPATPAQPAAPATPAAPPVDTSLVAYDEGITDAETKLTQLKAARAKAREDVDLEKADKLNDEIAELTSNLTLLRNERAGYVRNVEQSARSSYEQQANQSRDRGLSKYTELQSEGSLHRMAFDTFVSQELAKPERARDFASPSWPEKLVEEFASKHGLKPNGAGATPAATNPPAAAPVTPKPAVPTTVTKAPVVQVPGAKLVTSTDGPSPSGPGAPSREELLAALPKMTPQQRAALIRQVPTARKP